MVNYYKDVLIAEEDNLVEFKVGIRSIKLTKERYNQIEQWYLEDQNELDPGLLFNFLKIRKHK